MKRKPSKPRKRTSQMRIIRIANGLSLDAVAKETGMSKTYLHQLEVGKSDNISLKMARRLAACYGVSLYELFPEEHSR